jgi:ABC-type polysaccharide/polyol phosphate export permease
LKRLIRYRWLLYELVLRDLRLRYRGSALGFAWTLLNPLLFMGVYTLVFSVYLRAGIAHFPIYFLSGMLPWNWFSGSVQQGTTSLLDGRMYVGKTVFPAEVLVLVPVFSNLANFVMSLPLLIVFVLAFHLHVGWPLLLLPVLVAVQVLLTIGILLFFATFNVFYRDLQQLVQYVLVMMFFLIPIVYPVTAVPESMRRFVEANPLAMLITSYQQIFYFNAWPDVRFVGILIVIAGLVLLTGWQTFNRYKETLGEYL